MRTLLVALVILGSVAHAEEAGPPDVLHGDGYDGRAPSAEAREAWLAVPRLILFLPRMLVLGLAAGVKPMLEWDERDHVVERVIASITSDDGLEGVRPVFNYELGFRPSFGISYFNERIPRGGRFTASAATGGIDTILANSHLSLPLVRERLSLEIDAAYRHRDDELFTGIGMPDPAQFARYSVDREDLAVGLSLRPMRGLSLAATVDLGMRRFANGAAYGGDPSIAEAYCARNYYGICDVDERRVPGFHAGTHFVREILAAHIDSRRDERSSGLIVDAAAEYTHGLADDRSSYLRLTGHVGTSFEIYRHRTLYLGVTAVDTVAFGDTPIPFTEMVTLGGPDDLRGFKPGRFRDASSLLATVEYRWPVWMWMDGTLFADYGGVLGPAFSNFSFSTLRPDVGIGFRMHTSDKFVLRIQAAWGFGDEGGFRLVIAGNGGPA